MSNLLKIGALCKHRNYIHRAYYYKVLRFDNLAVCVYLGVNTEDFKNEYRVSMEGFKDYYVPYSIIKDRASIVQRLMEDG